jgi:beta-N-acetylhexosaminidase
MAGWFHEAGINTNLAPVVDVNVNPSSPAIGRLERSYSSNPEVVADHALAFIEEFANRDVVTALKHFPGHGSALADSHFGFTDITNTWKPLELTPYVKILEQLQPDMIMTGHLFHQGFDTSYPASLSDYFITDLLRDSLGYDGVVISDEMFMRAVRDHYTFDEAIVRVINSGTDILLFNNNRCSVSAPCGSDTQNSLSRYVINLVLRKIDEGAISESRIDESYRRIKRLKEQRITTDVKFSDIPQSTVLHQNYPNPFNPTTTVTYDLPESTFVQIKVFDVIGRQVAELVNQNQDSGTHSIQFNAWNLSSGTYLIRMEAGGNVFTNKMLLIK